MKFEFTTEEANYVANVLSQRPYAEVKAVLEKMTQQANNQEPAEVAAE